MNEKLENLLLAILSALVISAIVYVFYEIATALFAIIAG